MFADTLLDAIGAWQRGWGDNLVLRETLSQKLEGAASKLPQEYKLVDQPCYRKRFIHKGELVDVIMNDEKDEGLASWTTDIRYAERFKGYCREGAVTGALFRHIPEPGEVILSLQRLWASTEFGAAAEDYRNRQGQEANALFNFRDHQGEVVLKAPLKGSEIIGFTGASSPFDELCDRAEIPEQSRDRIFKNLIEKEIYPGEWGFTSGDLARREQSAQRVVADVVRAMNDKIAEAARQSLTLLTG